MSDDSTMHLLGEINRLRDLLDTKNAELAAERERAKLHEKQVEELVCRLTDDHMTVARQRDKLREALEKAREALTASHMDRFKKQDIALDAIDAVLKETGHE